MNSSASFHIRGVAPLICHNPQLADPLNEWAKAVAEISSKRKKTEKDHEELAHREFLGGLYMSEKGPVIPAGNIERMLRDAAAKSREGKNIQAGAIVVEDCPIIYDGPKDAEKLWGKRDRFAIRVSTGVARARIMRTRPWFPEWELKFEVLFDDLILNRSRISDFVELAGRVCGLGDWRPKHGRFEVLR